MSASDRPYPSSSSAPTSPKSPQPAAASPLGSAPAEAEGAGDPSATRSLAPLDSQQLLQGRRELQILHQGEIYRLQQTRQGKLILIK
jgi:hemin uptake protein HemP